MKIIASFIVLICASISIAQEVKPFKNEDNLYGLKTEDGKTIVEAKYDHIHYCNADGWFVFVEKENGARRDGIMNTKGEILLPAKYSDIGHFHDGYAVVKQAIKEDKMVYVVKYNYGIINTDLNEVVKPQYESIKEPTKAGTMVAQKNEKFGLINLKGEVLIDFTFDKLSASGYRNYDYFISKKEDKFGLISIEGKEIVSPRYSDAKTSVRDEGWVVSMDKKWGMVDLEGKTLIDFIYDDIDVLIKADETANAQIFAEVKKGKKSGTIDSKGKEITPFIYDYIGDYSEDYIDVKKDGRYGFIDGTGKVIIEPIYKDVKRFRGALAAVKVKKKWGYITNVGKWAIEPQFDEAMSFSNGEAWVKIGKEDYYIDPTGKKTR